MLAWLLACGGPSRPDAVPRERGTRVDLRRAPFAEVSVPPDSRNGRADPTSRIPLDDGWLYAGKTRAGAQEYTTAVPIRPRGLFFFRETPGVAMITRDGAPVPYRPNGGEREVTWSYDRDVVHLWLPADHPAPGTGDFLLDSPVALGREAALHFRLSDAEDPADFVRTRVQDGIASRTGMLLPAPGVVSWDVTVPESGELTFAPGLVQPEVMDGPPSDGATLVVELTADGRTEILLREALVRRDFPVRRLDLSRWSGRSVRLTFRSDPAGTPESDFAFVGEPVLASRVRDPVRVVFVFVDTVRTDHLSLYGYERDTSAAIDHLKGSSAVFTHARSTAPWTLPSSRSVLTGRYPDRWDRSRTLQDLLGEAGFSTGFIAGNVYLTTNFGMERDFDYHQEDGLFPSAEATTDDALEWLDAHDGRDVFLQVHYMSAHLPYDEPFAYRRKYAGAAPDGLPDGFELGDVRKSGAANKPELQQYVRDRYDNNIRYATDQIQRIVERLDDNDVLVFYSDHGEEFWEHKTYEHGHTLYDELLRVPLVIRGHGMPALVSDAPVSLLDIAPTVLDLLGLPIPAEMDGRSLVTAAAAPPSADRTLAFGWPLYGAERWGVVSGPEKWTTHEGREALFDLATDPEEHVNLVARDATDRGAPFRARLGQALERDVHVAYRLNNTTWKGKAKAPPLWALCSVPGGFSAAWVGDDPLDNMHASVRTVGRDEALGLLEAYQITDHPLAADAAAVEMCWQGGFNGPREIFVVPERPMAEIAHAMACTGFQGDRTGGIRATVRMPADRQPTLGEWRTPINKIAFGTNRFLYWQYGIAPAPGADTAPLDGRDPEVEGMLAALGYVAREGATEADARARACEPPQVPLAPMGTAAPP